MPIQFDYNDMDVNLNELDELEDYVSEGDVDVDKVFKEEDSVDTLIENNFHKVVVVDHIPDGVPPEKHEKLKEKLMQLLKQCGEIQKDGFYMACDESQNTLGFVFVAFKTVEGAQQAVKLVNGFKFTKKHVFDVFPYTNLSKYANWPDEYQEPTIPEFERPLNLNSWLMQKDFRDQYVIRHGSNTEINWCEGIVLKGKGTMVYDGSREREKGLIWCEMYTAWSPKGSYLTTFHRQGVALWGGDNFDKIRRFAHVDVQHILFSPNERYLMTWNGKDDNKDARSLIVWDVKTGREMRSFKVGKQPNGEPAEWPVMRWSPDDQYFARQVENGISVYESKTMKLLEKKSVKAKGIQQFEWSNSDNLIAYWAPEVDNMPARVVILDPVTRVEKRSKNLFNVREVKLHWQNAGDFLCAQVLRHTKSGKTTFTNFEIFRMRDANIPNEMLELKGMVEHFSWEPSRERFGVIHGENQHRLNVSFYTTGAIKGGSKVELLYSIPNKQVSTLYWSPAGNSVIFTGKSINGTLEFWDVDENVCTAEEEHFMCNEIQWDPSGRIVATIVTQPMFGSVTMRYKLENGFNLWTFQGQLLKKEHLEHFYQFAWRPRPKSELSEKEKQKVVKHLAGYIAKFTKRDDEQRKLIEASANKDKIDQLTQFRALVERRKATAAKQDLERERLGLIVHLAETEYETMDEIEEVLISEKVIPL
mmetsp:Transcript_366/g.412  ORF Transcript_366/g.412 Transcript_366/m.412 type:complete len:701 (+) Transcript_366:180-2282(+)